MNDSITEFEIKLHSLTDQGAQIFEKIDLLNALAWEVKYADAKRALHLSMEARGLCEKISYPQGLAYALRNSAAGNWLLSHYHVSLSEALESLRLCEETGDLYGQAHALNIAGNVHERLGNHPSALDCHFRSLQIREEINDREGASTSLNNLGNVYCSFGDYANALFYYLKSLRLYEEIEHIVGVARALNNIGGIYRRLGEYERALDAHRRSLEIKQQIGDKQNEGIVLVNIGKVYECMGDYMGALDYYHRSLQCTHEVGDRQAEAASLSEIGNVYKTLGDREKALDYYARSLKITREIGIRYFEIEALINLGVIHIQRQERERALKYLRRALAIAEEIETHDLLSRAHQALSEAYELKGDLARALKHYKAFHKARQEVFGDEAEKKVNSIIIQLEVEKSQQEAEIHRLRNVELAQTNAALQEANKLKTELLHIAAHDLKNPLQAVMGFAEFIRDEVEASSHVNEMAAEIFKSSGRMFGLINGMLEAAALESGRIELKRTPVDVGRVAERVVLDNRLQAELKAQRILFSSDDGCIASADPERLAQALDNLISNAIKYSPRERAVRVAVRRKDSLLRVTVRDEGPGLTPADLDKLFEKFQRLSAQPTGGESSTGIGLNIAKLLVELHGGRIWAESRQGHGTSFFIELPVIAAP